MTKLERNEGFLISNNKLKSQILETLNIQLADNTKARIIDQHTAVDYKTSNGKLVRSQEEIHRMFLDSSSGLRL